MKASTTFIIAAIISSVCVAQTPFPATPSPPTVAPNTAAPATLAPATRAPASYAPATNIADMQTPPPATPSPTTVAPAPAVTRDPNAPLFTSFSMVLSFAGSGWATILSSPANRKLLEDDLKGNVAGAYKVNVTKVNVNSMTIASLHVDLTVSDAQPMTKSEMLAAMGASVFASTIRLYTAATGLNDASYSGVVITPISPPGAQSDSCGTGCIVGAVVGSVVGFVLIVIVIYCICTKCKSPEESNRVKKAQFNNLEA